MGKSPSSNNRRRGYDTERKYARIFRDELGYTMCKTTRAASRLLDSCKIDLVNCGANYQIKRGYKNNRPKADIIFKDMKDLLGKNFPKEDPIHALPKVLIHEMTAKDEDTLVTMAFSDYKQLLIRLRDYESGNRS